MDGIVHFEAATIDCAGRACISWSTARKRGCRTLTRHACIYKLQDAEPGISQLVSGLYGLDQAPQPDVDAPANQERIARRTMLGELLRQVLFFRRRRHQPGKLSREEGSGAAALNSRGAMPFAGAGGGARRAGRVEGFPKDDECPAID